VRVTAGLRPAILQVGDADNDFFAAVLDGIQTMPYTVDRQSIVRHVVARCAQLDAQAVKRFVEGILAVISLFVYYSLDKDEFVEDISEGLRLKADESPGFDHVTFGARIRVLLDVQRLIVSAKAFELLFESRRHVVGSRVLTDVRPIFGDDATQAPLAAIITHTLKLQFHEAEGTRELFLSFDKQDMHTLLNGLQRAIDKESTLAATYQGSGFTIVASIAEDV